MRNHVLEVLKRTTATVAIAAMLLCGVTACSSGGYTDQRTIKYSDGGVYSGSVQEGKRSGYGTFSWTNGETYVGLWNDDQLNGKGTFTTSEGISWIGIFSNSALTYTDYSIVGNGLDGIVGINTGINKAHTLYTYTQVNTFGFSESKKLAYDGDLKKFGEFTGTATIGYWNGDVYSGIASRGKKEKGIYVFKNGDRYDGTFFKDRMCDGVYTFSGGQKLEGHFDNGVPSGKMTYTVYNTKYITTWQNGTCVAVEKA